MGIVELTNGAIERRENERHGDQRTHIGHITRIEGMRIWPSRVQRICARRENEAENREDEEDTHVRKAGGNANVQSRDEAIIQPES
jgi:hypothetical protein